MGGGGQKEKGMDEGDCSSVESTSKLLCVHDPISLNVRVK